jgi:hypothetical protein
MNLGALIPLLKLAQDVGLMETKKTTIFEEIRPKKVQPGTITVNLDPMAVWEYEQKIKRDKALRKI